jgi:hypothetical protein
MRLEENCYETKNSSAINTVLAFPSWSKNMSTQIDLSVRQESEEHVFRTTLLKFLKLAFK